MNKAKNALEQAASIVTAPPSPSPQAPAPSLEDLYAKMSDLGTPPEEKEKLAAMIAEMEAAAPAPEAEAPAPAGEPNRAPAAYQPKPVQGTRDRSWFPVGSKHGMK